MNSATLPTHRGSIFLEEGEILAQVAFPESQYIIRIYAPKCAAHAQPGSFAHLTVDHAIPMRRPLSIMRVDSQAGWIDILYKSIGSGLTALAQRKVGESLSVLGPIGQGFTLHPERDRPLLIGGGVGIPPMIFLAELIANQVHKKNFRAPWQPLVLMGSEIPFPFAARPSTILVPGIPDGVIAAMPLLDIWGIPSRLASRSGFAGCHEGFVTELACAWLKTLSPQALEKIEIFACGPTPMLQAVTQVAATFGLPCQVSLEEFMACAVGGCAGCSVLINTPSGPAMKRVCVDGPVFDAYSVFDVGR